MLTTLCIETSSAHCSLALGVGDEIFVKHELLLRRHNERVLPMLDELLHAAGLCPTHIQLIGFGAGPGSFTGVRIAASIAQGIALAAGFEAMCLGNFLANKSRPGIALLDLWANFLQIYLLLGIFYKR